MKIKKVKITITMEDGSKSTIVSKKAISVDTNLETLHDPVARTIDKFLTLNIHELKHY